MIQIAFIYWDPRPEVFTVPYLNWPILWYGLLFALGFAIGFPIFVSLLLRYFLQRPDFEVNEIKQGRDERGPTAFAKELNQQLVSEQPIEYPLSAREARPASYSLHDQAALRRLKLEKLYPDAITPLRKLATLLTDRLTVYMVVATVIGARVGHYLFYEKPSNYLNNLGELFEVWNGGLASHGAAIGIVLATGLFAYRYRDRSRGLSWLRILDFVAVPTALAGALIRIGNFFNQEILGKKSCLPWAVVFGHPADHSAPAPRHPVQLYEAAAYLLIFFLLLRLSYKPKYLLERGRLIGLFLILVFGARFLIEFWKLEQSHLLPFGTHLTMGQILSIPAILAGIFLFFRRKRLSLTG